MDDKPPLKDAWSGSHDPFSISMPATAEAKVAKFCLQVKHIKCYPWDDRLPPNMRGQGYVTRFFKFCPNHIRSLESVKLGTSNVVC